MKAKVGGIVPARNAFYDPSSLFKLFPELRNLVRELYRFLRQLLSFDAPF